MACTSCSTTCSGGCSVACASNCSSTCSTGCSDTCSSNCADTCSLVCSVSCSTTCSSGCSDGCSSTCSNDCSSSCSSTCSGTVVVDLGDIYIFNEFPLTVSVGNTFTFSGAWDNADHTAFSIDGGNYQQQEGEGFSYDATFDTAGTYTIKLEARNTPSSSDTGTDYDSQTYTVSVTGETYDTWKIYVELPKNRDNLGTLKFIDKNGVEQLNTICLGRGSNDNLYNLGDHSKWWLTNADTPTGTWTAYLGAIADNSDSYGDYEVIRLYAIKGQGDHADFACYDDSDAVKRSGFLIHGGKESTNELSSWYPLRPTYGCIRVKNEDHKTLRDLILNYDDEGIVTISGPQDEYSE